MLLPKLGSWGWKVRGCIEEEEYLRAVNLKGKNKQRNECELLHVWDNGLQIMNYGCELVHFNLCEVNFNQAFVNVHNTAFVYQGHQS